MNNTLHITYNRCNVSWITHKTRVVPNKRFFAFVTSSIRKGYYLRPLYVISHMCILYFFRHTKHNIEIQCTYLLYPLGRCFQNLYGTLTLPIVLYHRRFLGYETPKNFNLYTAIICLSGNTSVYFMSIGQKINLQCIYEGWKFNSGNYLFTTDTK